MSIPITIPVQGLLPAYPSPKPLPACCVPPIGGHRGIGLAIGGTPFVQGEAIGVISTTPANSVYTLTLGSSPSGTVTVTIYMCDGPHTFSFSATATAAQVQAAMVAAMPGWDNGNMTVTGSSGGPYHFTAGNVLANQAIGGNWTATITSGTATWAESTPGSSSVQYDSYSQALNNTIDGAVEYYFASDYTGARISEIGQDATDQVATCRFFERGIFNSTDLVNFDANALTLRGVLSRAGGTLIELY